MRNRAKCKLCESIIESFHRHDYVKCKCEEIAIDGGRDYYKVIAKDFENFLRIDDEGNEIPIKVIDDESNKTEIPVDSSIPKKPKKSEVVKVLKEMANSYENLPQNAMISAVTHYDLHSLVLILSSIVESLLEDDCLDT